MRYFTLCLFSLILAACTSTPSQDAPLPQLTFKHLTPIPVDVSRIEFTNTSARSDALWDIGTEMPTSPDIAMQRYFNQRFIAKGSDGVLRARLVKARVKEEKSPHETQILSYIRLADTPEYSIEMVLELETLYRTGLPNTTTATRFLRKVKMPFNASLTFKEAKLQRTLEEMMTDIDESVIVTIANKFGMIAQKDIPKQRLLAGTTTPETETQIGTYFDDFTNHLGRAAKGFTETIMPPSENLQKQIDAKNKAKEEAEAEAAKNAPEPLLP